MYLTTTQWELVLPLLKRPSSLDPRGRKRKGEKKIFEGVLWILKTGAQWSELPRKYGAYQTAHRRYQEWVKRGVFEDALRMLAEDLEKRGAINLKDCFVDGTFASAKKGGSPWGPRSEERAVKSWQLQTELLFRSPSLWALLLQARLPWWKRRLPKDLHKRVRLILSGTKRTTATRMTSG